MVVTGTEVFDLILSVLIGALYGYVGWVVGNRAVSAKARLANQAFAVWWWGLGALTLFGAVWTTVHWSVEPTLAGYMAWIQFVLLIIMIALAGLLYYFLYLWSGRQNLWVPVSLFYLVLYVFFVYYIQLQEPVGFDVEGEVIYANDLSETAFANIISSVFLLPTIIGAVLYLSLIRKARDPLLRFRIALVAGSIIVWFMISLTSGLSDTNQEEWWTYVSRAIAATAAILTVIAYRPPAAVRRWLHLEGPPPPPSSDDPHAMVDEPSAHAGGQP